MVHGGEGRPRISPLSVTQSYAIAEWQQLVVWVVDGHTPVEELERLRLLVRDWSRERGARKNAALTVLHSNRSTMSSEERASVARMIDETKGSRIASATVVMAEGMVGALHRSILTGLSLVVPPPHPVKITSSVDAAIQFLRPYVALLSGTVEPADIRAIVDDLHAAILTQRRAIHREAL